MKLLLFPAACAVALWLSFPVFARPLDWPDSSSVVAQGEPIPSQGEPVAPQSGSEITAIGPLALGMPEESVVSVLGPPAHRTAIDLQQASGLFTQTWTYPERGVELILSSAEQAAGFTVETIMLEEPSPYLAAAGIGLGTLRTEAVNRMEALLDENVTRFEGSDENHFGVLVGSTYTVLAVGCENGVVKHIYLGPGPE